MNPHCCRCFTFIVVCLIIAVAGASVATAGDLASGELLIRGATLTVSPERQEVDPGRPTVVRTSLGGVASGRLPAGMRVEGELSGPGLESPLHLSTVPGEAFQIPGLNREGSYLLGGIRLTQDGVPVLEAQPDAVEIVVHRLVIASVTSRPLTPEEMKGYGIVIDEGSYSAYRYSVGFATESGTYEIPFDILVSGSTLTPLTSPDPYQLPVPSSDRPSLNVPQINPVVIEIPEAGGMTPPTGSGNSGTPTIPGFLVIPTDMSFLHQFFSVILVVQNGALEGSGLELHHLAAHLELSSDGLRQANTEPPSVPGEAVSVLDPGPDGEVGTGDDLTIIVAQASGEASWLVEGLAQGQHLVTARLAGEIHGLASGEPAPISADIPGVVLVRDPRFSMTFFHPWTVRGGEAYQLRVVVTNTSVTPVYDLSLRLPATAISGAMLAEPAEPGVDPAVQSIPELLPGSSAVVAWDLVSLRTGRVTASAFNASSAIDARFEFSLGVGELGIPLSPESIVLPPDLDELPKGVTDPALELLGLAYSLATAPEGAEVDLPPIGESIVRMRGQELAGVARRVTFGEPVDRALVSLGLSWLGTRSWCPSWDALRRRSSRGADLESQLGAAVARRMQVLGAGQALDEVEEIAITGRPMLLVRARGAGYEGSARLRLIGGGSGTAAAGQAADTALFERGLPGAAVMEVRGDAAGWSGELGLISIPLNDDGQWSEPFYQVQLDGTDVGSVDLEIVLVSSDGSTVRLAVPAVATAAGSLAFIDLLPPDLSGGAGDPVLYVDSNGDRLQDETVAIAPVNRPAPEPRVLVARIDPLLQRPEGGPYTNVMLLMSQAVDAEALALVDAEIWTLDSHLQLPLDDGGTLIRDRMRRGYDLLSQIDPAMLVLSCSSPLNPHADLAVSSNGAGIPFAGGRVLELTGQPLTTVAGELATGAVSGLVVGSDGLPLPGAVVELYEYVQVDETTMLRSRVDQVEADDNGAFVLDAVRYRDEYVPFRYSAFMLRAVEPSTGHQATLMARLPGDGTARDLTLFMVGRGDVVGTLRRADGEQLEEPIVAARSVTDPREQAQATPDAGGWFRLQDLPVGSVQILARDGDSYSFANVAIPGPGQEAEVHIVLPEVLPAPLAQVEGKVIDGDTAEPVTGVQVFAVPEGTSTATHAVVTEDGGLFAMQDVPPGMVTFQVWDPVRGRYVAEHLTELVGDTTNTIRIVTVGQSVASVSGTVYRIGTGGRVPVVGAYVICEAAGTHIMTDENGAYRLEEIPLGTYWLEAFHPDTGEQGRRQISLLADGQEAVLDIDITGNSGRIVGHVVDRAGVPLANVEVAIAYFGSGYEAVTNASGTFEIAGLPPDTYDLVARLSDDRLGMGRAFIPANGGIAEPLITIGGTVSLEAVTVADTQGGGTAEVLSSFSYRRPGVTPSGRIGTIPSDGALQCVAGDPTAECWIDDTGHAHFTDLPEGVGSLLVYASNGFYGTAAVREDLDPTDDGKLLRINFSAPARVTGRVVLDVDGELLPVPGAFVEIWTRRPDSYAVGPNQMVQTGADGVFDFDLLPRGPFSIRVYEPTSGALGFIEGGLGSGQLIEGLEVILEGTGGLQGEVAICFLRKLLAPGDEVLLTLKPSGFPEPFISTLNIPELAERQLEVDVAGGSAPFVFTGLASGTWVLRATSASRGSAIEGFAIPGDGSIRVAAEPVCLYPTGSLSGQVIYPETGAGAADVTVQLFYPATVSHPDRLLTADTTAADGTFSFTGLPVNKSYLVRAYDAANTRAGSSENLRLCASDDPDLGVTCWRDATTQVELGGLGTVTGVVLSSNGTALVDTLVRLRTSVTVLSNGTVQTSNRELLAMTGADGRFSFAGIEEGTIELAAFDPASPLWARGVFNVNPIVADNLDVVLTMPSTADVRLTVHDPLGDVVTGGNPAVAFKQSSNDFRELSGRVGAVVHLAHGPEVTFSGVAAGSFEAAACLGAGCPSRTVDELLGHHYSSDLGAAASFSMPSPADQTLAADLQLVARADAQVQVLSGGAPVQGAEVRVSGSGFYGGYAVVTQTVSAAGETGVLPGLGVGSYTASATLSDAFGNRLRGATTFDVVQADHGATLGVVVELEQAAAARGRVLTAAGEPAVAAAVTMRTGSRSFQVFADAAGDFEFAALPANTSYELSIYEAQGLGQYFEHAVPIYPAFLDADGVYQFGELMLDDACPEVAAVDPVNGASAVAQDAVVMVDFNELLRHETITGDRVRLRREGSTVQVSAVREVEDLPDPDGGGPAGPFTRITLDPVDLASETLYLLDVRRGVEDLAGRTLLVDRHFTFRTADSVPPQVLTVDPEHDPSGTSPVGPDVTPLVSFNEVIDASTVNETTVRLIADGGQEVMIQRVIQRDGFDLQLRPASALDLDTFYTIEVAGITDTSGNALAPTLASRFRVRDISQPVVGLLPPLEAMVDGDTWTAIEGRQLTLRAAVQSNDALAAVVFGFDGEAVGHAALDAASGEYRLQVMAPMGASSVMLSLQAQDVSGNPSELVEHLLLLTDDQPPTGSMNLDPETTILPNHVLTVFVQGEDDFGVAWAHVTVSGALETETSLALSGTSDSGEAHFRVPVDAAAASSIVVDCEIEDSYGQRTPLVPRSLSVAADVTAPVAATVQPPADATFTAGDDVLFQFDLSDDVIVASAQLTVDGEVVDLVVRDVVDPGASWTAVATADWIAPEVEDSVTVQYSLALADLAGNQGVETGSFIVEPKISPWAPQVTILCPLHQDLCAPDVTLTIDFEIVDPDDDIQSYTVFVDGVALGPPTEVHAPEVSASVDWTPPLGAVPGSVFEVVVEADDYAGNLNSASIDLVVVDGTVLTADLTPELDASFNGHHLVLASGDFTAVEPLQLASLQLLKGAKLTSLPQDVLRLEVTAELRVSCGATIDVTAKGYPGAGRPSRAGSAPPAVQRSVRDAGGSHGGLGEVGKRVGPAGETYDSIAAPELAGGGGATDSNFEAGGVGGGVILIEAAEVVLDGALIARGEDKSVWASNHPAGGGGGTVSVQAQALSGSGRADARGGSYFRQSGSGGLGGGGRVALLVDVLDGFDPTLQVSAAGGGSYRSSGTPEKYAGCGTVFVRTLAHTHGDLIVDQAAVAGPSVADTPLPLIGQGTVGVAEADTSNPADLWIEPFDTTTTFSLGVVGMWVRVDGTDYRVIDQAGRWRILLQGATGQVSGGTTFQGVYKFDNVTVSGGAHLIFSDLDEVGEYHLLNGGTVTTASPKGGERGRR